MWSVLNRDAINNLKHIINATAQSLVLSSYNSYTFVPLGSFFSPGPRLDYK